jgi:hypothetical protein
MATYRQPKQTTEPETAEQFYKSAVVGFNALALQKAGKLEKPLTWDVLDPKYAAFIKAKIDAGELRIRNEGILAYNANKADVVPASIKNICKRDAIKLGIDIPRVEKNKVTLGYLPDIKKALSEARAAGSTDGLPETLKPHVHVAPNFYIDKKSIQHPHPNAGKIGLSPQTASSISGMLSHATRILKDQALENPTHKVKEKFEGQWRTTTITTEMVANAKKTVAAVKDLHETLFDPAYGYKKKEKEEQELEQEVTHETVAGPAVAVA